MVTVTQPLFSIQYTTRTVLAVQYTAPTCHHALSTHHRGADIHAVDREGSSALHHAAWAQQGACVQVDS